MNDEAEDPIKRAERLGYARGYQAGQKRLEREDVARLRAEKREEFRERAFLAALPSCIVADGWKRGDVPITMGNDRVRLAWDLADQAVKGSRHL